MQNKEIWIYLGRKLYSQKRSMTGLIKTILENEEIQALEPDFSLLTLIPKAVAQQAQLLIFGKEKRKELKILTTNNHPDEVKKLLHKIEQKGYLYQLFYTTNEGFALALQRYDTLEQQEKEKAELRQQSAKAEGKSAISLMKEEFEQRESQDPAQFITTLIRLSFQAGASDLHFQPEEQGIVLRLRIDGVLQSVVQFSHQEFWKYMQKIKFMSGVKMNIDYLPQDWRFSFEASDRNGNLKKIDARISFMPWVSTESIVIRFLDATESIDDFEQIGFSKTSLEILEHHLHRTNGIIIITWPTGSGKTTTLYAILKKLNDGTKKIITLEDPIEYKIAGLQQSQINYDKGYDYETGLKAILRQDPDIILVGETRTKETAQIAINASLTWHLVFTTLHTNSVLDSLSRLMNMGIEPYLLTPALQLMIGQRLVRKVCPHCWAWENANPEEDAEIRKKLTEIQQTHPELWTDYLGKVFRWKGCEYCNHSGYLGRIAILEILEINDEIREKLMSGMQGENLLRLAKSFGFIAMQEDGILKVVEGITDLTELHRVLY